MRKITDNIYPGTAAFFIGINLLLLSIVEMAHHANIIGSTFSIIMVTLLVLSTICYSIYDYYVLSDERLIENKYLEKSSTCELLILVSYIEVFIIMATDWDLRVRISVPYGSILGVVLGLVIMGYGASLNYKEKNGSDLPVRFSTTLNEVMEKNNISSEDIAKQLQIRSSTVSKIVEGKYIPSLSLAQKIATIVHKPTEELFILNEYIRPEYEVKSSRQSRAILICLVTILTVILCAGIIRLSPKKQMIKIQKTTTEQATELM